MTTFKIFFSEDNIRRIRLAEVPTYEQFITLLQDLYPKFHPELKVKYVDADGDRISLDTQIEWEEMLMELQNESSIRLWVEEANGQYFKDGPDAEPIKFYADKTTKQAIDSANDFLSHLQKQVPECLSSLFRSGKIIPSHIPEFLKEAVSTNYIADNIVDIDVDIPKLFDVLHQKAVNLLKSVNVSDLEQGRDYLIATLTLVPDHVIALYNLACAESLLGNVNGAIENLEKAIDNGFRDFSHLLEDADFENIKNTEAFQIVLAKLASLIDMKDTVEEPIVESIPEPIPEPVVEPIPEPVVEPTPELSASIMPLKSRFSEELDLLNEMGFSADPDVLLLLLEQFEGNVDDVSQFLLGFSQ